MTIVCGIVRSKLSVAFCAYNCVQHCTLAVVYGIVHLCAAIFGNVWQCLAIFGNVWHGLNCSESTAMSTQTRVGIELLGQLKRVRISK